MELCRTLNGVGARYLICGGFAIIHAGYLRTTGDVDLLIDAAQDMSEIKNITPAARAKAQRAQRVMKQAA